MKPPASSYYPPRAGHGRAFRHLGYEFRHWMYSTFRARIDLRLPATEWRHVWCLLVPGFSFIDGGWPRIGRCMLYAWCIAALVFLSCLGYAPANWAFAAMLSLHVTSVMQLVNRTSPDMSLKRRLVISLAVLFVVGQLLYGIALRQAILPLQYHGNAYVVHRLPVWVRIKRGEWVALHTHGIRGQVKVQGGYVLSRVLAGPGDTVTFDATHFSVNGVASPRLDWMPRYGSLALPEKKWLIWPELDTLKRVNVSEDHIAATVLQIAQVRRQDIIGKPFKWWFWRDQTL